MMKIPLCLLSLLLLGGCYAQNKMAGSEQSVLFPIWAVNKSQKKYDNRKVARRDE